MKKKFSTLIAGLFVAGLFPVVTFAHHGGNGLSLKSEIPYRTQATVSDAFDLVYNDYGVSKIDPEKWYQLEVSDDGILSTKSVGSKDAFVLVQLRNYETGELYLKVAKQSLLTTGTVASQGQGYNAIQEPSLNSSLWKIKVVSYTPGSFLYTFTNKETGYQITYNCADANHLNTTSQLSEPYLSRATSIVKDGMKEWRWYTTDEVVNGVFSSSKLYVFNHDNSKVLGLVLNDDEEVVLVDIPYNQVVGTNGEEMVSDYNILRFTVRNAGARVLNAADINSMIDADGSWANRKGFSPLAKFKEAGGFKNNVFFTTDYKAIDTEANYNGRQIFANTYNSQDSIYAGYSIVLQDKANPTKYFMVATDDTYESDQLPSQHGGLKVLNAVYPGDEKVYEGDINPLKARYHWKVTYYPTPDSLVFEPLNASVISFKDKQDGLEWADTPLAGADIWYYHNTINESTAHVGNSTSTTSVPFNKDALELVALTIMNNTSGIDNSSVLTVGLTKNSFDTYHSVEKYGKPVLTHIPADMGLKVQFNHTYTYLTRGSVANDVYFIQVSVASANKTDYRKEGMYLVYNMEGRLMYDRPDDYQDYEQMPATQWVIERDSCDYYKTGANYVRIKNREYGNLAPDLFYGQLYSVAGTNKYYIINHEDYDIESDNDGKFPDKTPVLSCGDTIYFTPVKPETKTDKYLGYKHFVPEDLNYETYALKYLNAQSLQVPNTNYYLSIESSTSLLGVTEGIWKDFEINTLLVDEPFGYSGTKAGAVQLYRTNYTLKVRDNNLVDNNWNYVVVAEDENGNSYYQMAHLQDVDGKNVKLGMFYFKADQITDYETPENAYALIDATGWTSEADFAKELWLTAAGVFELNSANPNEKNIYKNRLYKQNGFKRADVKDQTAKVSFASLNTYPMDRVSAFVFEQDPRPLYKPLNLADGNKNVKIYENVNGATTTGQRYLFENRNNQGGNIPSGSYLKDFGYLGITTTDQTIQPVGESTTAMYADSVISSFYRMPQYLFFVAPDSVKDGRWCVTNQHGYFPSLGAADADDATHHEFYNGYVAGRVLVNFNDSVNYYHSINKLDSASYYKYDNNVRLGFVEAIHTYISADETYRNAEEQLFKEEAGEYLYILKGITLADLKTTIGSYTNVIDPVKFQKALSEGLITKNVLDGYHKNYAFSLRYTDDDHEDLLLESFDIAEEGGIGSFHGGWVKIHNSVPVLAQSFEFNGDHEYINSTDLHSLGELLNQAQIFNVNETSEIATSNESVNAADEVKVVGGQGTVTIYGAAGKTVTISNILGQTVANTVLTSDNATIAAPKGIVVIAVQGEEAVKAVVK